MNKTKQKIIGSRASQLALIQTNTVKIQLEKLFPEYEFIIKTISTKGDQILSMGLSAIGDKGLFTKELESAMLNGEIDFAVHSLKDLPTSLPEGLIIGAVTKREKVNDVLISNYFLAELPENAIVGTSSLRRRTQLKRLRADLSYIDIRGNLNTRLAKLDSGQYDAIILAYAGVIRLDFDYRIKEVFSLNQIIPAAGQGALAVECRADDHEILTLLNPLNHQETNMLTTAERTFLKELQGGCQVPIGAIAILEDEKIVLTGFISDLEGNRFYKDTVCNKNPVQAGTELASILIKAGAEAILNELLRS